MKKSVADKILATNSFLPLAEEIAPELNEHLTYYADRVGVVGHSFGSRLAAAIPSVLDGPEERTKFVAIDDAPSWQKPLIFRIAAAQLIETIHLSKYIKHSPDSEAQKAWRENDGEKMPAMSLLVQLRDVIAMSRGGFVEDLKNSLKKLQPGTPVTLFAPELSRMNDNSSKNIRKLITSLSQEFPGLDIRGVLVEDSTHNVSVANPAYFGQMIKLSRINLQP